MPQSLYKFGEFELDCCDFELRRQRSAGKIERVGLERIPMELLILLAERQGNIVTRQEIVERLWGKDVFVDTDHGINTAIRKVRRALRDNPERPRFVQTVTGRGYRFVGATNGQQRHSPSSPPPAEMSSSPRNQAAQIPEALTTERASPTPTAGLSADTSIKVKRGVGGVVLALVGIYLVLNAHSFYDRVFHRAQAFHIRTIAVLPLVNLSGDESQNYFVDGMTDEVITMLAKNTSLHVISRTSVMRYKNVKRLARDIAHELGADGILAGSIERSADRVHMTVQLIDAPSGSRIWAENYDRGALQAMALPAEISEAVAIRTNARPVLPAKPPQLVDPEAHDLFLKGQYLWYVGETDKAEALFHNALKVQPDYAAPWAGLSECYGLRVMAGMLPLGAVREELKVATQKAVELDDTLPEAHNVMTGWFLFFNWDFNAAEAESLRSITLNPNFVEGYHIRSYVLMALNRRGEAMQAQRRSTELDPFYDPAALGRMLILNHQFEAAIAELRLREQAHPRDSNVLFELSEAHAFSGKWQEAANEMAEAFRIEQNPQFATQIQRAYQRGGYPAVAEWKLKMELQTAGKQYFSPYWLARDTAQLRLKERTLRYLEDAFREHSPRLIFLQNEPVFDFLHTDPRYQRLVRKVGLPPVDESVR
jgi:TolB-like protein/DNA-binding winged helix-turn-helix (wHTH) protein